MGGRLSVTPDQFFSVRADLLELQQIDERLSGETRIVDRERRLEYLRLLRAQIRECRTALDRIESELKALP